MLFKRQAEGSSGRDGTGVPTGAGFEEWFPALCEWLSAVKWDDGKKREAGTAMLVSEGGKWKLWLHDRDAKRSSWVSAAAVPDLLALADKGLTEGALDWRPDKR